jgi:hypothetical protein
MLPGTCPHCGGGNPAGAVNCQWCGLALPQILPPSPAPSEPLPTSGYRPLPVPPSAVPSTGFPPAAIVGIVVFVVILLIIVFAFASITSSSIPGPNSVQVSQVLVQSSDNACGLNGDNQPGFSASGGASEPIILGASSAATPCTVSDISTSTPGFQVLGSFPMQVSSYTDLIAFSVLCPSSFSGVLTLDVS